MLTHYELRCSYRFAQTMFSGVRIMDLTLNQYRGIIPRSSEHAKPPLSANISVYLRCTGGHIDVRSTVGYGIPGNVEWMFSSIFSKRGSLNFKVNILSICYESRFTITFEGFCQMLSNFLCEFSIAKCASNFLEPNRWQNMFVSFINDSLDNQGHGQ